MTEVEVILKACDYGKHKLVALQKNRPNLEFNVEWIGKFKVIIHLQRVREDGKIIMQQYWSFTMFNGELCYDNGYRLSEFIDRYNQTIKNPNVTMRYEQATHRR